MCFKLKGLNLKKKKTSNVHCLHRCMEQVYQEHVRWGPGRRAMFTVTHCSRQLGSIFMATYTIRLLMWWMMDNCWVIWPRQRFPMMLLTCQYKWQQKTCPGGEGEGGLQISNDKRCQWNGNKNQGKDIVLFAIHIPIFVGSQPHAWLGDINLLVANMVL